MTSYIKSLTLGLCLLGNQAISDPAGFREMTIDMPHHGHAVQATLWYPNGGGGKTILFADNPVFAGVQAGKNARLSDGDHPLVLFSHGMGGSVHAQAWLASGLAKRGAIVAAVNHKNTTWGSFDMSEGAKHWTRAQDVATLLDALLGDPKLRDHIDSTRVMAAGFSYGGWTALSLGGLRGNHDGFVSACEEHIETMEACNLFLSDRVNAQGLDSDAWNADYRDPRVSLVAAIDPGFVWGLAEADVSGMHAEVLMIGFGDQATRMQVTDFVASGLEAMLPAAEIIQIEPAFHFTAMPLCKPAGAAILAEENDDPVCTDPHNTDRAAVHERVIEAIAAKLGL